jgi:hypothetical protein
MANSLKHVSVGTSLSQTEWEAIDGHAIESQAIGDLLYAESTSSLRRLGIGSTGDYLRVDNGRPDWQATTSITSLGTIATGVWQATDVGVAYGGTGVSTLTDGGVLLGSGANAITAMAVLTDGQMIVGNGSTDPVAESGAILRTSIGVGTGDSPQFTDLTLTDDLVLNTDSSVFSMGIGADFSITHDGTTGATLAGNPITITSAGAATWSTSSGALTLTSAAAATWSTSAGVLTIDGNTGIVMQTTGSGNVRINELLGVGGAANALHAVNITSTLATDESRILSLNRDVTLNGNNNDTAALEIIDTWGRSDAAYSGRHYGIYARTNISETSDQNWTDSKGIIGVESDIKSEGSGTSGLITGIAGFNSYMQLGAFGGGVTATDYWEYRASGMANGTVGTRYGFYAVGTGGTITTQHGLYVADMTGATNDYGVTIEGADTAALWIGSGADNTDAANGIYFGASKDLHMYRAGANHLVVSSTNGSAALRMLATTGSPQIELIEDASAGTNMNIAYKEGAGNGAANNKQYVLGYDGANNRFRLYSYQAGGASSADDIWRIADDQANIDAKDLWQDNQFDVYDDAKVLSPYRQGKMDLAQRQKELIDMGVLKEYEDGWVGYNDQRMAALLAGGIYQTRERVDSQYNEIDKRLAKIEAALGV